MKKRILCALLCAVMVLALLPASAFAAGETVSIGGVALTSTTPYYVNGGGTSASAPASWNAWLDVDSSTLHLNDLNVSSDLVYAIDVSGFTTLNIELTGSNEVTSGNDSNAAALFAINTTGLVIYGAGNLTAKAEKLGGAAIKAGSIKLQYPAALTVIGNVNATSVKVDYSYDAYGFPVDGSGNEIRDYTSNVTAFENCSHVEFSPQANAKFPVWVNNVQMDSTYFRGKSVGSGTVTYTPAAGSETALLTLNGATIDEMVSRGSERAGIYARDEPLRIRLIGANTIDMMSSENIMYAVRSYNSALTFEADTGATLAANVRFSGTAGPTTVICAIKAEQGITFADGCGILSPIGARLSTDGNFISGSDGTTKLKSATIGAVSYGIALSPSGTHSIPRQAPGYNPLDTAFTVTVRNTGNQPTGALSVTPSDQSVLSLSTASLGSIAVGDSARFEVQIMPGLAENSYYSSITVAAESGNMNPITAQVLEVTFTVGSAAAAPVLPTYTVYNDKNISEADVRLTGAGLDPNDMLIVERMKSGSLYDYMVSLAPSGTTLRVYDISLKSGSKGGYPMYLSFDLGAEYEGQIFTLIHRKANSSTESFTAMANPRGTVTFGPLSELSPFSIVRGSVEPLSVAAFVAAVPDTGDAPLLWPATVLVAGAAFVAVLGLCWRKRRDN